MKKEKFDCGEWSVKKENGEILIAGDRYIARVYDWAGYNPPASKENAILHDEAEANARLIASAPEMLGAISVVIGAIEKGTTANRTTLTAIFDILSPVLKKALGE
jgi:hypothetical protein